MRRNNGEAPDSRDDASVLDLGTERGVIRIDVHESSRGLKARRAESRYDINRISDVALDANDQSESFRSQWNRKLHAKRHRGDVYNVYCLPSVRVRVECSLRFIQGQVRWMELGLVADFDDQGFAPLSFGVASADTFTDLQLRNEFKVWVVGE